jgi:hypothetical protein
MFYNIVAKQTASGQAKRGDRRLEQTRILIDQNASVIDPSYLAVIEERMTQ